MEIRAVLSLCDRQADRALGKHLASRKPLNVRITNRGLPQNRSACHPAEELQLLAAECVDETLT